MRAHTCVRIHTAVQASIHECRHACTNARNVPMYMHVHIYPCMYTYVCTQYMHTCRHPSMYANVHAHHVPICTHAHATMHACTHMHTHTRARGHAHKFGGLEEKWPNADHWECLKVGEGNVGFHSIVLFPLSIFENIYTSKR